MKERGGQGDEKPDSYWRSGDSCTPGAHWLLAQCVLTARVGKACSKYQKMLAFVSFKRKWRKKTLRFKEV